MKIYSFAEHQRVQGGKSHLLVQELEYALSDAEVADKPEVADTQGTALKGVQALVHASRQPGLLIQEVIIVVLGFKLQQHSSCQAAISFPANPANPANCSSAVERMTLQLLKLLLRLRLGRVCCFMFSLL